jgi:hypothetical protein
LFGVTQYYSYSKIKIFIINCNSSWRIPNKSSVKSRTHKLFVALPSKHATVCFRSSPVGTSSRERRWRCHLTAPLRELLTGDTREANNYREHTQEYDSGMRFASVGAELKLPPGNDPHCFRIHVQIYRLVFKHNRSEMVAVLGPYEALPYYIHTVCSHRCFQTSK